MTCEECLKLLPEYVTGGLDASEAQAVRSHLLTGCPRCVGEFTALDTVFHEVGLSLEPLQISSGAWERLERQITVKEGVAKFAKRSHHPQAGSSWWIGWAVAAASLLLMGMLLWRSHEHVEDLRAKNAANEGQIAALSRDVEGLGRNLKDMNVANSEIRQTLEASQRQAKLEIARLASASVYELGAAAQSPEAKLFWNKGEGTWTLFVSNLKALPAGKTYQLWIINDKGEKIGAGTFDPDKEGRAIHEVRLPANTGTIVQAAVTDESFGGASSPKGVIQFAGKL